MSTVRCERCGSAFNVAHLSADAAKCSNCGETLPQSSAGEAPVDEADQADEAGEAADWFRVVNWSLAGLAGFLVALIAVVLVARQMRPWVHGTPAASASAAELVQAIEQADSEEARRLAASRVLEMGSRALADALDQATHVSADRNMLQVSGEVIATFAGMPQQVAEPCSELLGSPREDVRVAAASILRNVGSEARVARDALAGALTDENRWVRWAAADALGNLGTDALPALDALLAAAKHPDRYTRRHAIEALGEIGPPAEKAVALLADLQENDPERAVRRAAETALHQIHLDAIAAEALAVAPDDVRPLIEKLGSPDEFAARSAAEALAKFGPGAEDAMPALGQALHHSSKWVRIEAAGVLAQFGSDARPYAPALRRLTADPDPEVRQAAEKAYNAVRGED